MTQFGLLANWLKDYVFPMPWLQIPLLLVVIAIIVGWVMYRRKQM